VGGWIDNSKGILPNDNKRRPMAMAHEV